MDTMVANYQTAAMSAEVNRNRELGYLYIATPPTVTIPVWSRCVRAAVVVQYVGVKEGEVGVSNEMLVGDAFVR